MDHRMFTLVNSHAEPCDIVTQFNEIHKPTVIDPLKIGLVVAAVEAEHQVLVEYLVNSDEFAVDLNYKSDYTSPSPLHAAVKIGRTDLVKVLLQHGASVNLCSRATLKTSPEVYTAVEFALRDDKVDILSLLEPSFPNDSDSLLHVACGLGAVQSATWLLTQPRYQAAINQPDSSVHKSTPLMVAVQHSLELTQLLLSHGAAATAVSPVTRKTALHYLLSRDYTYTTDRGHFLPRDFVNILHTLILAGCDVNVVDSNGDTALSLLCMHPHAESVIVNSSSLLRYDILIHRQLLLDAANLLIDYGASTNIGSDCTHAPLSILINYIKLAVVQQNWASQATVISLMTSRDLFMLIGLRCDGAFNSLDIGDTAASLLHQITSNVHRVNNHNNDGDNNDCDHEVVMTVIADICSLLMFVSSELQLLTAVSAIVPLTNCLTNICSHYRPILSLVRCCINLSRYPKALICSILFPVIAILAMNGKSEDAALQQQCAAMQLVLDSVCRPRSLKQLSRLAILRCLEPRHSLRHIHSLGLPPKLVEYMYTISD